ncbi:MAG TPA: YceI family protein [Symbiobacteriaceae bacterium]|nr:YceI family protein [Symbiobacteriaceae bacterium]
MKGKILLVGLLAAAVMAGCGGKKEETKPTTAPAQQQTQTPAPGGAATTGKYTIVQAESNAQYSVKEVFITQSLNNTAVGKTNVITGDLVFDKGVIQASKIVVDVKSLKSDKAQRDDKIKTMGLETDKYGTAEFAITGVEGTAPAIGATEAAFKLKGNLKVHGVEKPVVWDAKAKLEGDKVKLDATITFKMADFNIAPPNILNMIKVEEDVKLDVSLVGKKS